jgi:hypothetical protein
MTDSQPTVKRDNNRAYETFDVRDFDAASALVKEFLVAPNFPVCAKIARALATVRQEGFCEGEAAKSAEIRAGIGLDTKDFEPAPKPARIDDGPGPFDGICNAIANALIEARGKGFREGCDFGRREGASADESHTHNHG